MAELWEYTKLIRSKNAGPFELTFDIMFKDRSGYDLLLKSGKLSARSIADLYGLQENEVRFFAIEQILAFKISIPRKIFSGDVQDTDLYGGQFHGPLVRLKIDSSDSLTSSGTHSIPGCSSPNIPIP
jgi:hypothetical protein